MPGIPITQYVRSGDGHIAYQVLGDHPLDLLVLPGGLTHLELRWEQPELARAYRRFAEFARVIVMDRRGVGLSDRAAPMPEFAEQVPDVMAVLDAVGSVDAAVLGHQDGAFLAIHAAVAHPDRVRALILESTTPKYLASDDFPEGLPLAVWEAGLRAVETASFEQIIRALAPERADDREYVSWATRYMRAGGGPGGLRALMELQASADVRPLLPEISMPTLVLHGEDDRWASVEAGRELARMIPTSRLVVLPRAFVDDVSAFTDEIEAFVTGVRPVPDRERVLRTVVFTDIVGSTAQASSIGDARWRLLLERHDQLTRDVTANYGGTYVKSTGDGALLVFDSPSRAIRCLQELRGRVQGLGIDIRAGLHAGEIELLHGGNDLGGLAVHAAARIASVANDGEVLVSRTVLDLLAGSGVMLSDRGKHELRGLQRPMELYAVT